MTKKLTWRLGKLPSPDEVRELVKDKIITQDEARNILFNTEDDKERDSESLKTEIKFLRELVDKLSSQRETKVIEIIKEIEKPYYKWGWYQPYNSIVLCGNLSNGVTNAISNNCSTTNGSGLLGFTETTGSFSSINNF